MLSKIDEAFKSIEEMVNGDTPAPQVDELKEDIVEVIENNDLDNEEKVEEIEEIIEDIKDDLDEKKDEEVEAEVAAVEAYAIVKGFELKAAFTKEDLSTNEDYKKACEGLVEAIKNKIAKFKERMKEGEVGRIKRTCEKKGLLVAKTISLKEGVSLAGTFSVSSGKLNYTWIQKGITSGKPITATYNKDKKTLDEILKGLGYSNAKDALIDITNVESHNSLVDTINKTWGVKGISMDESNRIADYFGTLLNLFRIGKALASAGTAGE